MCKTSLKISLEIFVFVAKRRTRSPHPTPLWRVRATLVLIVSVPRRAAHPARRCIDCLFANGRGISVLVDPPFRRCCAECIATTTAAHLMCHCTHPQHNNHCFMSNFVPPCTPAEPEEASPKPVVVVVSSPSRSSHLTSPDARPGMGPILTLDQVWTSLEACAVESFALSQQPSLVLDDEIS